VPIRVGLLTEGHDHLILRAYLAKLLDVPNEEIEADYPDGTGHGNAYVAATIDRALRRFYNGALGDLRGWPGGPFTTAVDHLRSQQEGEAPLGHVWAGY
jgi:hypothetical protein